MAYLNNSTNIRGSKARDYRCFRCGVPIYFASKDTETPSGKPTKDPITGKHKMLDQATKEYHICKSDAVENFRQTEEFKQRILEWKANQQQQQSNRDQDHNSASFTKDPNSTLSNWDVTNNRNLFLEQILTSIDYLKADLAAIKSALRIGTDSFGETEV
jgi:hypothetical protein